MSEYIYLCPECSDCLFAFGESYHDRNQIVPCQSCGYHIELWRETPDERQDRSWHYEEYGSPREVLEQVGTLERTDV
jgi:DNA-directed RNA polymerase subunit RPC12/RpoP